MRYPRSYSVASEWNPPIPRPICPFCQLPSGHPVSSPWKRSWVRCKGVNPQLPSPVSSPGDPHLSEEPRWCWNVWGKHPLLPGPLGCEDAALAGAGSWSGNKGQEPACLRGELEFVLWSGFLGAQVGLSPELPFSLSGLPTHPTALEQGEVSRRLSSRMLSGRPPGSVPGSFERLLPGQRASLCQESELDSWVPGRFYPWL